MVPLLIDARPALHPDVRRRGIGRYTIDLIRALHASRPDVLPIVSTPLQAAVLADVEGLPEPIVLRPHVARDASGGWWIATGMFLGPPMFDPIPRAVTAAGLRVASVLYDVIPFRQPDRYQADGRSRAHHQIRAALAGSVDATLAISAFSAATGIEALTLRPETVTVIGAGYSSSFSPGVASPERLRRLLGDLSKPTVVAVTGGDPRKNTEGLLEAWGLLEPGRRAEYRLVIVAETASSIRDRWLDVARHHAPDGDIAILDGVDDDELVDLLRNAALAVQPSLDEGFGLPVLEAAACGAPVICSNTSALSEVIGLPEGTFDPAEPRAISDTVERALTDQELRVQLLAAGRHAASRWTWDAVAERVLSTLTIQQQGGMPSAAVPIAVLGPFAGSPSGIGDYDERVTTAIAAATGREPVRLVEQPSRSPDRADVWPAAALGRAVHVHDFDHVVAVFGSSPHHAVAFEHAHDGVHCWLHEASLVGLHVGRAHRSRSPEWSQRYLRARILDDDGEDALDRMLRRGEGSLLDPDAYAAERIRLIGSVVRGARSVIVSSAEAAATVRAVCADVPVAVIPLGIPDTSPVAGCPESRDVVVAGWLGANKALLTTLDVLELLPADTRVHFVGPAQPEVLDALRRETVRRGLAGRVVCHGRVNAGDYDRVLRAARVGLQLRSTHQGEMSAAIADFVARAVPVVTTLTTTAAYGDAVDVVAPTSSPDEIAAAVTSLLVDDDTWLAASSALTVLARSWTFDHVAAALLAWFDRVDAVDRGHTWISGPDPTSSARIDVRG